MTAGSDSTPGLLWRLDVKDRDGESLRGYPRIFTSDREYVIRLGHLMTKNYEKNLGYTFIKSGCTRSAWLNLDGPVAEGPVNHGSTFEESPCLPRYEELLPDEYPVAVSFEAA